MEAADVAENNFGLGDFLAQVVDIEGRLRAQPSRLPQPTIDGRGDVQVRGLFYESNDGWIVRRDALESGMELEALQALFVHGLPQ